MAILEGTSANPILSKKRFLTGAYPAGSAGSMSIEGTVHKTAFLLLAVLAGTAVPWSSVLAGSAREGQAWLGLGVLAALAGLGICLLTIAKKEWSAVTAPLYALSQGVAIGGLSASIERIYPGISLQAVSLTFGVLAGLLLAYQAGLVRATPKFKLGVLAATGGVAVLYLATLALSLFGVRMPFLHETGLLGIAISAVITGIAALNLVLDFDFIEASAREGAPRYMEWYGAFGMIVTLVWLYIELLRLITMLQGED